MSNVQSVERAINILDVLAQGGWRTGAEIARELHVHRSTALRLLGTLERHALVERDGQSAKYRLGKRLPQLASVVTGESDLRSLARPVCAALAAALGETVTLDILAGDEIVPIEQATGSTSVVSVNERLLARSLERSTPHTITDRTALEAQLDAARAAGHARTHEELEVGLDAIAAPVYDAGGEVAAAVDVSGPSHRLRAEDRPELVRLTLEAASDLSRRLGFRGSARGLTAG